MTGWRRGARWCALAMAAAAFASGLAGAATLAVSPIRVEIGEGGRSGSLSLANRGESPVTVQTRAFRWSRAAGRDRLDASGEIMVSPAMATIEPGETQVFRALVRSAAGAPAEAERAFRIVMDEVPEPRAPGASISFRTRLVVPVFVRSASHRAIAAWTVTRTPTGLDVVARNTGTAHLLVSRIEVEGGPASAAVRQLGYVFPGEAARFTLRTPGDAVGRIKATTNLGVISIDAPEN